MSQKLYLECYSGISGDMTVAALLDLGADQEVLKKSLASLELEGYEIEISRVKKAGIDVCDFNVHLDKVHENHDHDMEYLHGQKHDHDEHTHEGQSQEHHEHHHHHEHRGLAEILAIIDHAELTSRAKELAMKIFRIIAQAEAKAHGVEVSEVHFHEVGAVDSIVDIVAIAVCIDNLDITEVIVPSISEGQGFVRCQHGVIPVPVPAVMAIAEAHGLVLHRTDTEGELVTPTGAAVVAALKTSECLPETYKIIKSGIGAGKRTYNRPSMLRAMLIEDQTAERDTICKLETNVDDCTGEALGYVMERLFAAGARDVHYLPVFMKKNRPAYQLNVICLEEQIPQMEQIIFEETTTIGIRRVKMERTVLEREEKTIETSIGMAQVKVCRSGNLFRVYPEYRSVIDLCEKNQMSYIDVYELIQMEYR
ncbi:MAG: nickel pincer cofactor biosynthesis protein LarC [Hespellia sp.]|nr:nickel pincer cofactor biosynthesis protein LarC [Hespellia sp.]